MEISIKLQVFTAVFLIFPGFLAYGALSLGSCGDAVTVLPLSDTEDYIEKSPTALLVVAHAAVPSKHFSFPLFRSLYLEPKHQIKYK